jgi:LuxR family maltose regulon positive regulatory protein
MVMSEVRGPLSATEESPIAVGRVLEEKLHPPAARAEWIERPRLLRQIAKGLDHPVLLVAAPAGYGKSTLVTQWVGSRDAGTAAWVYLDPADNDPTRLWTHITAALERVGCRLDVDVAGFVAGSSTAILTHVLPRVVEVLAACPHALTVVLDDLQVLRNGECCDQLDYLIGRLPDRVHLVLISRSDPQLRLGRLRVGGKLADIRTGDLSFTADEVAAVLRAEDVTLSEAALRELVRQTEGWPAAVYLAALSLVNRTDAEDFVRRLSGNNRLIADYLSEEVLSRQDPELRDFILSMSIFSRFNAALADHVTQSRSSARLLQRLERTNLFLMPLQTEDWVRFHHLFAAFARSALEVERPELVSTLHLRGAQWFEAHGLVEDGVHHLIAAGAHDEAAMLIQASWVRFLDAGRAATVLGWLRDLRGTPADSGPAATVTAAWIGAVTGDRVEMRRRLDALESMEDATPLPDGTKSPQSAMVLVRGTFGFDGPDQMLADARRAVQLETDSGTPWYAVALSALGYAAFVTGDVELARRNLAGAARAPAAPATIRVLALGTLSLCEAEQGRAELSARLAGEAMDIVTEHGMQTMAQATFAATAYGVALTAQNRLEAAAAVLEEGLAPRRKVPGLSPWPLVHHLIAMAVVAARSQDRVTAEELLDEVESLTPWTDESMAPTRNRIAAARSLLDHPELPEPQHVGEPLTPREQEILRRLHGSQTLREIATDLYVSHNTVKTITSSLYRKLGAHSRVDALSVARRLGGV